jgi:tetratricopeptide (TPR) repeat protein
MSDETNPPPGRQPIPPNIRRRLQQMFEHGCRSAAKGDFGYASEMFTQCVTGDPGNLVYVQNFLGNLRKQYNNNKSGSKLAGIKGMTAKGTVKKCVMQKDYSGVFAAGLEMLKLNPWDPATLAAMADACEKLDYDECQLEYLKGALDADIKDPEINRLQGRAMARQGKYDEAIMCWNRVLAAKPTDDEARRAVHDLQVERTIHKGGYETAESSTEVMADKALQNERLGPGGVKITPEQQLEKQIKRDPSNTSLYLQLADMYSAKEQYKEAEEVLTRALEVSGGEVNVRERLEDTQLRYQRGQIDIAKKRAAEEKTPEAVELYRKMKAELNHLELQVYRNRCERYPTNLGLKFQLGVRLKTAEMYNEAIKAFQEARNDPQRKGEVLLSLGECFQQIKQYKLALTNYEQAIEEISERDQEMKNLALYRAGWLCLRLAEKLPGGSAELDKADKYLTELAGRDFGYKDVAECLDKVRDLRDKA